MKLKSKGRGVREPGKEHVLHWLGLQREYRHDTYKLRGKLREPTVCSRCGAVYQKGRWRWGLRPARAQAVVCPACRRVADNYPAGILRLSGPFLNAHRQEILNAVRHQERLANKAHPFSRIISIKGANNGVVMTTTDMHLPRRIGEALWHAYHGELKLNYAKNDRILRMAWKR